MMTPEDVKHWQKKMGFTYEAAAEALGVNRATFGNYVKRGAPLTVALACSALTEGLKGYQMEMTEEDRLKEEWSLGDYVANDCPNCGRQRLCICQNGKHRCEKCNWSPELNGYAPNLES